jgi:hypothetical protein
MESHIKVVGWIHIAFGAVGVLIGGLLGGFGMLAGIFSGDEGGLLAGGIMGFIGMFIAALAVPSLLGGWGLLTYRSWARILVIVLSILNILNIPFGTLLGGYSLWVLFDQQTQRIFQSGGNARYGY